MKKLLFALSMILTIALSAKPFPVEKKVDPRILSAFQKEFWFARNVNWDVTNELSRVSFSLNDQDFIAWYDEEAELICTARKILYMQLPLSVIKSLEENYVNTELSEITEVTKDNATTYYLTAENKSKKFLLQASPSGIITKIKKLKK